MTDCKRPAHALWQCKYHLVWRMQYRFRILSSQVARAVQDITKQLCEWKRIEILATNIQVDHFHLVVSLPPKYFVSVLVRFLKGKSAVKIFHWHLEPKRRYRDRHFWAKGYCVSTGGLEKEQIRKYVLRQLKRDRNIDQLEL